MKDYITIDPLLVAVIKILLDQEPSVGFTHDNNDNRYFAFKNSTELNEVVNNFYKGKAKMLLLPYFDGCLEDITLGNFFKK